jgi:DNA repair photolyase
MDKIGPTVRGRGAADNPANRFEPIHVERDSDGDPAEEVAPATRFFKDATQSILSYNDSPDLGFSVSVNPYRGCEHGCIYCYARPTHEYLGFSAGLDFETKIMVKERAPELLRQALSAPKWNPQVIAFSGVTDCYQPVERKLKLTRGCLEVAAEFRNPVGVLTKNHLVTRDFDLLGNLARSKAASLHISVTTLNPELAARMEPRTSLPAHRLAVIESAARAGIPTGVLVAPVIPGLNDHEIPALLSAAARAGAQFAGFVVLRLPHGVGPLFESWLARHFPERKDKVLHRLRSLRGGKLNDSHFGSRMRGEGVWAEQIASLFSVSRRKAGLAGTGPSLSSAAFRRPPGRSDSRQSVFPF